MKKIFLDANIIIDLVSPERPNHSCVRDFLLSVPINDLYISSLSVHIVFYVLKIKPKTKKFSYMKTFLDDVTILPLTESIIKKSMDIEFSDFEDCLQYFSAVKDCDYILTRDKKDFERIKELHPSKIQIVSNPRDIKD